MSDFDPDTHFYFAEDRIVPAVHVAPDLILAEDTAPEKPDEAFVIRQVVPHADGLGSSLPTVHMSLATRERLCDALLLSVASSIRPTDWRDDLRREWKYLRDEDQIGNVEQLFSEIDKLSRRVVQLQKIAIGQRERAEAEAKAANDYAVRIAELERELAALRPVRSEATEPHDRVLLDAMRVAPDDFVEAVAPRVHSACSDVERDKPPQEQDIETMEAVARNPAWLDTLLVRAAEHGHRPVRIAELERELAAAKGLRDMPQTADFSSAVALEADHQVARWGVEHDAGKGHADWFWLLGYLAGKALHAAIAGDIDKALHHTISSAAALLNWHRALSGQPTAMRPGIEPPDDLLVQPQSPHENLAVLGIMVDDHEVAGPYPVPAALVGSVTVRRCLRVAVLSMHPRPLLVNLQLQTSEHTMLATEGRVLKPGAECMLVFEPDKPLGDCSFQINAIDNFDAQEDA